MPDMVLIVLVVSHGVHPPTRGVYLGSKSISWYLQAVCDTKVLRSRVLLDIDLVKDRGTNAGRK